MVWGFFYERHTMIISASRRSDIPAFYLEWFIRRLREGFALVRNPINPRQVSRIDLSPETVDGIVFWSKNPAPLLRRLDDLRDYSFYVQFTINPYGRDLEGNLPEEEHLFATFEALAEAIGPERVVWRYSPVIVNAAYSEAFHLDSFAEYARRLNGLTCKCNLAFLDIYAKIRRSMRALGISDMPEDIKKRMASLMFAIAKAEGITLGACGNLDLAAAGVPPARCVDAALLEALGGKPVRYRKDPGQRSDCYCTLSADIGSYNTCPHECAYCYANYSPKTARKRLAAHDPASPMLCDQPRQGDVVTIRKQAREKRGEQKRLF